MAGLTLAVGQLGQIGLPHKLQARADQQAPSPLQLPQSLRAEAGHMQRRPPHQQEPAQSWLGTVSPTQVMPRSLGSYGTSLEPKAWGRRAVLRTRCPHGLLS